MKAPFALFASCAPAVGALGVLENHCRGIVHDLSFGDQEPTDRELNNRVRKMLAGGAIAVVTFGDIETHDPLTFRVAKVAARNGLCALVLTTAGYIRLIRAIGDLDAQESMHLTGSVSAAILVGRDTGASFPGFSFFFPETKATLIGGFGWSSDSCIRIIKHIGESMRGGSLV